MKKRALAFVFAILLLLGSATTSYAATNVVNITPALSFSGTNANCKVTIRQYGASIDATLSLWYGNTCVASWHDSAISQLVISEIKAVVSGRTYTLKVSGTIGGVAFNGVSVTETC